MTRGIGQVVEVDRLAVAVDPGCDEAESVELGRGPAVTRLKVHMGRCAVERDRDAPRPVAARGIVLESPAVRLPVGQDPGTVDPVGVSLPA